MVVDDTCSQIVLALTGSGEVFMVDMRKSRKSRVELVEPPEEGEEDDAGFFMVPCIFGAIH